jgi:predicted ATPase/DNA-binding SARP family transcriptional activator
MARLSLRLFGPFHATLDGELITAFKSDKARALLAYLVVEAERPHHRETVAGLLWPEWPERDARGRLRRVLSNLRLAIGDREATSPFLQVSRQTIQFNTDSDAWVDVAAFTERLEARGDLQQLIDQLEEAVDLYRGDFLEGFSIPDSASFEEWALLNRERFCRLVMVALSRLVRYHEQRGDHEGALRHAWRQVELEPWHEKGHQQVMRLLALSGQRGAALAQYEACRRLLTEELAVEPGEETTRLYEQIRDGDLEAAVPASAASPDLLARLPRFLQVEPSHVERLVFVARERELAQLDWFLETALAGQGQVAFVTGEAGSGKTALAQEFSRRAQDAQPDLVVASGNCNAHTGVGDPYLPFRHILELLTGDVAARWAAGAMTGEHARRLWNTLPLAAEALVEAGPDLIDTFVHGAALLERATTCASGGADWLVRLHELVRHKPTDPGTSSSQQSDLFEQYTRVLQALAQRGPLLLVLDDLQWADLGSISLLFHLGRQLAGSRILIVGLYRPEEVAIGRNGERHPLEPVVNEFQRVSGDIKVNLSQAESRDFVEALLDSEPNRLGPAFRKMLNRQTRGHPLFTIELLRGLQERGDLVRDPEGRWVEGPALDWETLPARVEAVIAERIGRLAEPLQAALRVGSVEGEVFTAEVVARIRAIDKQEVLNRLSGDLDRRHRLIRAQSIERIDGQLLSRYRFRHILFQKYLYGTLDEVERVHLHEQVGTALEGLYTAQEQAAAIAVQLARHFQEARIANKAIHYLHRAGERAVQLSAYQEAIAHLTRGLALLKALPDPDGEGRQRTPEHRLEHAKQELALQLTLGIAWMGGSGTQAPEVRDAYIRARELCRQTGSTTQLCQVLGELSIHYYVRAEHREARRMAEESLSLAQQAEDPLLVAIGHWYAGIVLFALGEYKEARAHLHQTMSFYDPQRHHRSIVSLRGSDVGVSAMAYDACCLWCLGYPDQALRQSQEALALAHEMNHPFTLADVLWYAGCQVNMLRRDGQALKENAEHLMRLTKGKNPAWSAAAVCSRGGALAQLGECQEGIRRIREGIAAKQALGTRCYRSVYLCTLAEAQARAGHAEEALTTLGEAFAFVEDTDECHWEAELYRVRGELLLAQGDGEEAKASFHKAIEVARRQHAKSWELRATVSLCRHWGEQGKREEAHQRLAEIYAWFTEGFDTADLIDARTLLEELSSEPQPGRTNSVGS